MLSIRRGTTPTITINITEDIDLAAIDAAYVSIQQDGEDVLDKGTSSLVIDPSSHTIAVDFTQAETLSLTEGTGIIQLRIRLENQEAYVSAAQMILVLDVIRDGVI